MSLFNEHQRRILYGSRLSGLRGMFLYDPRTDGPLDAPTPRTPPRNPSSLDAVVVKYPDGNQRVVHYSDAYAFEKEFPFVIPSNCDSLLGQAVKETLLNGKDCRGSKWFREELKICDIVVDIDVVKNGSTSTSSVKN